MSKNSTLALAAISHPELRATNERLARLQADVVDQFNQMRRIRGEEAKRGLVAGMTLWAIKESLPHGEFGKWADANITHFGKSYRGYLMSLALIFIDRLKVQRPEMLALRGDQMEMALDKVEDLRTRFAEKAAKFVGELSLSDLFVKHGLKKTKALGGAREKGAAEPAAALSPQEMASLKLGELAAWLETGRYLLIEENCCQHLAAPQITGFADSLDALRTEWRKGLAKLLKAAPKVAAIDADADDCDCESND